MSIRILLSDLAPGHEYALQFRSNNGDGGVSEWSQIQRFTTTNDTIRPGNIANLTFYDTGDAFIGVWDKIVLDENGNPLRDFRHYHINISDGTTNYDFYQSGERFVFSKELNERTFGSVKTTLTIKVWAVDLTYNESPTFATVTATPANPPTPSTPTTSNYLGLLTVAWDGKDNTGATMPGNVSYAEVHVSTTSGFTPSTATFVARVLTDGSASKVSIPGLTYGTTYYVRLIAVNSMAKRSGASTQATGSPARITNLDITNGTISTTQINFTAKDIGGANAYYVATTAARDALTGVKNGDIAYITGSGYATYRYNGTSWASAPEIGVISGTKILTGTLTSDAVGTNLLITASANIGTAVIDQANIGTVNAASIRTGSIAASQRIIAGPSNSNHAEITDTGFYVKGPQPGGDPLNPVIIDRIRMGTGVSDFIAIPDPVNQDATLAQIDENGIGSFQGLNVVTDPVIGGRNLSDMIDESGSVVGEVSVTPINGLEQSGAQGIRSEYGIGQFSFPVKAGRTYQISFILSNCYLANSAGTPFSRIRVQTDTRTPTQIADDSVPPTPCTITSTNLYTKRLPTTVNESNNDNSTIVYRATTTGIVTAGYFLGLLNWSDANTVIKVVSGSAMVGWATDLGPTQVQTGAMDSGGGTLYSWTSATPSGATPKTQYYKSYTANWVRSYTGTNAYMTNTNGRAYQGQDPSGYNGNQIGYFGFSNINFTTLLSGATVDKILVYLYFAHWYYNSGGTARVGYHNVFSDPGTASRTGTIAGTVDYASWPKPGGRKLLVTSWGSALQSGAFRGIALGPGNNSYLNYGYATTCSIEVWYTK